MKFLKVSLCCLLFTFAFSPVNAQITDSLENMVNRVGNYLLFRQNDTNYISNYGNEVALKINFMNKYNYFSIYDLENNSNIRYRPARSLYTGLGFAYKWIALDLNFSTNVGQNDEYRESSFDFQGRVYSSKHFLATTLQYYRTYRLKGMNGVSSSLVPDSVLIREDIRTVNMELQYLYSFNYTRFSLKAPFVFNERQIKSAGSPIFGATFSMFDVKSDSSLVPVEISQDFLTEANLDGITVLSLGASFGYMYTLVVKKHFFLTASLIPGLHFNAGDYSNPDIQGITPNFNIRVISMNSIGYNGRRIFTGITYNYNGMLSRLKKGLVAEIGHGKLSLFVGWRFLPGKRKKG